MPKYKFADLCIQMNCQYDIMQRRSEKYKTSDAEEETFTIDIPNSLMQDWIQKYDHLTPAEIELILMGTRFSARLLSHNGFCLHASAIAFQSRGILFSADSGVGKSTHTRLWQQRFGQDAVKIINDDKPALRHVDDTFYVYGTPFSGNSDENLDIKLPLYSIVFLERADSNSIRRLTSNEALPLIMKQTLRPKNSIQYMDNLLSLLNSLLLTIPVYLLHCNMQEEAAELVYKTISPGE